MRVQGVSCKKINVVNFFNFVIWKVAFKKLLKTQLFPEKLFF